MADVKIRFAVNPDAETEKLGDIYVDNVDKVSNTSFAVDDEGKYQEQPADAINGVEGLSWAKGYLVFNANGYLANEDTQSGVLTSEQEPQEFVWGATDNNGYYEVKVSFRNATNLDAVVFYGDTVAKQFPTMAFLDNSTDPIYSDDARWAIKFSEPSAEHSILFVQWNRPNYNAVLTKIAVMPAYVEIDKYSGLKSVESLSQISNDSNEVNYTILPNSGRVSFIDINGDIEDFIKDGIINNSDLPLEVYINDKKLNSHISTNSDYNINTKEVNFELEDKLSKWDVYQYGGYKYNGESKNAYQILESVLIDFGYEDYEILNMCDLEIVIGDFDNILSVKDYLETIQIQYPYLKSGTYRETIEKFCKLAQLRVALNDDGEIKFYNARPIENYSVAINPIIIPSKHQFSTIENAIVLKNKFSGVSIPQKNIYIENKELSSKSVIFYELDKDNHIIDKTDEIESEFRYAPIIEDISNGDQRWYTDLNYEIDFDVIYFKNAKIKYESSFYNVSKNSTINEEWIVDLPLVGDSVGSFNTGTGQYNLGRPLITNIYSDTRNKIHLKIKTWVGGDILMNGVYYYLLNNSISVVADINNANDEMLKIGNAKNKVELDGNELIQRPLDGHTSMPNLIMENILRDYENGITFGTIDLGCADYYTEDGNKVIDWKKGEILKKGDIIRLDKDNNGNPALKYANGNPIIARIISRTFSYIGRPILTIDWEEVKFNDKTEIIKKKFSETDWETIDFLAQNNLASQVFSIGDEKTITLTDGTEITLVIVGFDHDDLTSGGKAKISIAMKELLADPYPMTMGTTSRSNNWSNCYVRESVLPNLFNKLPSDLQAVIKNVNKKIVSNDYEIITTSDKLWLYSDVEITGSSDEWFSQEGQQYEFWAKNKAETGSYNAIKKLNNGNGDAYSWWYRSLLLGSTDYVTTSAYGAVGSFYTSTYPLGICCGLCI